MQLKLCSGKLRSTGTKRQRESGGVRNRSAAEVHRYIFWRVAFVERDQQAFARCFASEQVVVVGHGDVLLLAEPQCRMITSQLQQGLNVGVDILLFGRPSRLRERALRVTRKSTGKIAAIVGIIATGHRDFVAGIYLRNSTQSRL